MADFKIEGHKEIIAAFRGAERVAQRETVRFFRDWSQHGINELQIRLLNAGSVDTNELIQGLNYNIKETKRTVTSTIKPSKKADKYALYVEEGTKPHFPPIKAIQGWADRHGIPAFVVAQSIATWGTQGNWAWHDTHQDLEFIVDNELDNLLQSIVNQI